MKNTITSTANTTCTGKYIKVVITRATTIVTGNSVYQPTYKSMVGKTMMVRKSNQRNYFETKSGYPVLITDCRRALK